MMRVFYTSNHLALMPLTRVRTLKERLRLGNCLAAVRSRIDIDAAWRAITPAASPRPSASPCAARW